MHACLGAVCLKTRLCAVYSDVCEAQCQRSEQQLLPPYTQRAADHTAHATKPIAVTMATGPLQPIKTPPLLSPLATAAALELRERARHPILRRAACFYFSPTAALVNAEHINMAPNQILFWRFLQCHVVRVQIMMNWFKCVTEIETDGSRGIWDTQTPRGGEKGCVTTPSLMTRVHPERGPSQSKR